MNTQTIEESIDLTGKTAIVTGGAVGIGQVIATTLAEFGAAVMIADSDLDTAYETVNAIRSKGGQALAIDVDLSNEEDAEIAVESTVKCFGGLDILVNAASQFSFSPALTEINQLWRRTLISHVNGIGRFCRAAAEEMIEQGHGGQIINIASVDAMRPAPGSEMQDSGGTSVALLSKRLAVELAPNGITVNALAPSLVQRPDGQMQAVSLFRAAGGSAYEASHPASPEHSSGEATGGDEIATVVLFLLSPAAKNITGNLVSIG
jgi:2-deoxy-D-gluconate 3-dehydrogenase